MRISALFSFWMGILFTLFALRMALSNLSSGDASAPETDVAAAGYALFWGFLAAFGIVMVVVSWLMMKGKFGGDME